MSVVVKNHGCIILTMTLHNRKQIGEKSNLWHFHASIYIIADENYLSGKVREMQHEFIRSPVTSFTL